MCYYNQTVIYITREESVKILHTDEINVIYTNEEWPPGTPKLHNI